MLIQSNEMRQTDETKQV